MARKSKGERMKALRNVSESKGWPAGPHVAERPHEKKVAGATALGTTEVSVDLGHNRVSGAVWLKAWLRAFRREGKVEK